MAFSCASNDSWASGVGCSVGGAVEASGAIEMRVASGAVVCGMRLAWGSHGGRGCGCSEACLAVLFESRSSRGCGCFSARLRPAGFSGLRVRVRRTSVSRSRTSRFSVRRSLRSAAVPIAIDRVLRCDVLARSSPSPGPPDATRGRDVEL